MRQAVDLVGMVNLALFAAIAVVCVRRWSKERATTALWAALAFVALAAVIVLGQLLRGRAAGIRREGPSAHRDRGPGALSVLPLPLRGGVRDHAAPARAVRRHAQLHPRRGDVRSPERACGGRFVAVVVRRVCDRVRRPLVGAAADRLRAPLARRSYRSQRRAPPDADARCCGNGDHCGTRNRCSWVPTATRCRRSRPRSS